MEKFTDVSAKTPLAIDVRGARVHNMKNIDIAVPARQLVAIGGVSGSGRSSLAMGVLYAEGSRRYMEALSTYTLRRISHAPRPAVDSVRHVPAALALRQRPGMPGVTFGTSTELLNVLHLMFSRLGSHLCPNGHRLSPTIEVAQDKDLVCPECAAVFYPPGAEVLAFNSEGACPACSGTGVAREIDETSLVPDHDKSIDAGAVAPWSMFGLTVMPRVAADFGVRTDIPYRDITDDERRIVMQHRRNKGVSPCHRRTENCSKSGAVLTGSAAAAGYQVAEATRMDALPRRGVGKSDPLDAHRIASAVFSLEEEKLRRPRLNEGVRAALRVVVPARHSMTTDRTRTVNALTALLRINDFGFDARKSWSGSQILEVSRWRVREEALAVSVARSEAV